MAEQHERPDTREIPEPVETDTRRATGMGNPGTFPEDGTEPGGRPGGPGDASPAERARRAASGRLAATANRVRDLGDQAASRHALLERSRPLAYSAADGIDSAATYVRERELEGMRSDLETQVRRHPLASVAIAFLAGYAVRRIF